MLIKQTKHTMKALYTIILSCLCVGFVWSQSDISSIEYFIDTDPGVGNATTIDINPDVEILDQNFTIPTTSLSLGTHRLYIRVINVDGTASLVDHKTFRIVATPENNAADITEAEYFFNDDPGVGNGTTIDITDTANMDEALTVDTTGLSSGVHRVFVRVKNSNNQWSLYQHKTFNIAPIAENNTFDITAVEYFFDVDPGIGNATEINISDVANLNETLVIPVNALSLGIHRVFIRVKSSDNKWSVYEHKTFAVVPALETNTSTITAAEYYIDADPGVGNGTAINITGDNLDENLMLQVPFGTALGTHYIYIRVLNAAGEWSLYERQEFEVNGTLGINTTELESIKIFPNPTQDFLNISLPENNQVLQATIYNLQGKEVRSYTSAIKEIDISALANGTYLLLLKTEKGNISKKIVKN